MKKEDVRMENINHWVVSLISNIESEVSDYDESISVAHEDELYENIRNALEKFFNYPDYKNYN